MGHVSTCPMDVLAAAMPHVRLVYSRHSCVYVCVDEASGQCERELEMD